MELETNKYQYLLDKDRYALIEVDDNKYVIYDLPNKGVVIIEIDSVAELVIDMMLKNNNKVLNPSDVN